MCFIVRFERFRFTFLIFVISVCLVVRGIEIAGGNLRLPDSVPEGASIRLKRHRVRIVLVLKKLVKVSNYRKERYVSRVPYINTYLARLSFRLEGVIQ